MGAIAYATNRPMEDLMEGKLLVQRSGAYTSIKDDQVVGEQKLLYVMDMAIEPLPRSPGAKVFLKKGLPVVAPWVEEEIKKAKQPAVPEAPTLALADRDPQLIVVTIGHSTNSWDLHEVVVMGD